jgi:hypothetical protein
MQRPAGVTVLAVLSIAFASVVGLIGVLAILWGVLVLKSPPDSWGLGKYFAVGGALIAVVCFAVTTLYVAIGWGLLKLRNWARILSIVFAGIGLASSPVALANFGGRLYPFQVVRFGAGFVIDICVLIYLFRPHVKKAFGSEGF